MYISTSLSVKVYNVINARFETDEMYIVSNRK